MSENLLHFNLCIFLFTNILAYSKIFYKRIYECRYPVFYAASDKY